MNYTHLALVGERPPRSQCGGSGRLVMRMVEVDCPDCLQLEADREARTAVPKASSAVSVDEAEPLMTRTEVAFAFRVGVKMPLHWARAGLITCVRASGGQPRFLRAEIKALLAQGNTTPPFLKAAR